MAELNLETRVETVDPVALQSETSTETMAGSIAQAAALIRAGGLVAFPTETVYGLGANALETAAVERVFVAKGRPAHDPLIVHVTSVEWLPRVAAEIPPLAYTLAERFWPGPLTLVLRRTEAVPDGVTAGGETVAVRAPSHPVAQALLHASGVPIAAPSANRFGHTSPTTAQHVLDDLSGRIDMILDGGPTTIGVESTVLDLTVSPPVILRHGGVTTEALREVIEEVAERTNGRREDDPPEALASPGLLDRHYAPHTPLMLFRGASASVAMTTYATELHQRGVRVCVLAFDEDIDMLAHGGLQVVRLAAESELPEVAQKLYSALRTADASGAQVLLAREPRGKGIGAAIRDRLVRAAETIVVANE